jgi:hypothetical protein
LNPGLAARLQPHHRGGLSARCVHNHEGATVARDAPRGGQVLRPRCLSKGWPPSLRPDSGRARQPSRTCRWHRRQPAAPGRRNRSHPRETSSSRVRDSRLSPRGPRVGRRGRSSSQLEQLGAIWVWCVSEGMVRASRALLTTDLRLVEEVITCDQHINRHAPTKAGLQPARALGG